jgi:hypothetical protein
MMYPLSLVVFAFNLGFEVTEPSEQKARDKEKEDLPWPFYFRIEYEKDDFK